MNYLQLCQRAALECGVTNKSDIPAAVTGQTGNLLRIVNWVVDAYTELQEQPRDWRWMNRRFTFPTVADQAEYVYGAVTDVDTATYIARPVDYWQFGDPQNPPRCYLTASGRGGEYHLRYMPWDQFNAYYNLGNVPAGQPQHITINEQDKIVIGPTPNDVYTISGKYKSSAQTLSDAQDIPELPPRFHMIIVYDTMRKYGNFQSSVEIIHRADEEGRGLKSSLRANQLMKFRESPPLA